jgi:hypothetical protein
MMMLTGYKYYCFMIFVMLLLSYKLEKYASGHTVGIEPTTFGILAHIHIHLST